VCAIFKKKWGVFEGLMVVKYSNLFTAIDPINNGLVTILVEYVEAENFQGIAVRSLEGKYGSADEFMRANDHQGNPGKIWSLLPLRLSDTRLLVDALSEALRASEARRP
jgi:hypothetical protein